MSMNLYFVKKIRCPKCGTVVTEKNLDFPFQTPTELSYQVMELKDKQKQYERLCYYVDDTKWPAWIKEDIKKQLKLIFDDDIELRIG